MALAASASALAGIGAADASATIRYAAPGGTATAASCTIPTPTDVAATPCSIFTAASGTGVVAADEVVIAPGNYSDTAGDLGGSNFVSPVAGFVHGAAGLSRPVITNNVNSGFGAFALGSGDLLSHVETTTAVSNSSVSVTDGTAEDLIARSSKSSGIACQQQRGVIRNSFCLATGAGGVAVGTQLGAIGPFTATLRNVTAVATGAGSHGLSYQLFGDDVVYTLSAKGVIASGTADDVFAGGFQGAATTIALDHSNYDSTNTDTSSGGVPPHSGTATVTLPGTGAPNFNQTAAAMLAVDGFHQLPGSPTIDAGEIAANSGSFDIDGQARTIGASPDIGADEFAHTTATALSCTPPSLILGAGTTTCTATVTDTATGSTAPGGSVGFSSTSSGSFSGSGSCILTPLDAAQSSCAITYTPSAVGTGSHEVTASYAGSSSHTGSQNTAPVGVSAPVTIPPPGTTTNPGATPNPPATKKCTRKAGTGKKGSKLRRGKCVKKKKAPRLQPR